MSPKLDNFRSRCDRHRLLVFVLVAFGWTWTVDAVYYWFGLWNSLPVYINTFPRQWGVPIGAIVVVWASDISLRKWLRRVFQWRLHPGIYLGALLLPVLIAEVQPVLAGIGGGTVNYSPAAPLHLLFAFFLLNLFLFGGIEEFGWRGLLQPQLQERLSVLTASLAIGVLWLVWHLPLFLGHPNFTPEPQFLVQYTVFILGSSVVLGALVNVTEGAVIPAVFLHGANNVGGILQGSGGVLDAVLPLSLVGAGLWWLVVAVLLGLYGRSMVPRPVTEPLA